MKLDGPLSYDGWCDGVRAGRCYVSDGFGHLMDLTANGHALGVGGSELALPAPGRVTLAARVACLLPERAPESRPDQGRVPYWTPEHARRGGSREVEVEAIVNGQVVGTSAIVADGVVRDLCDGGRDRAEQLGGAADPRLRAHQSDLRGGRRASDPRLTPQRGVVPGRRWISAGRRRGRRSGTASVTPRRAPTTTPALSTGASSSESAAE